MGNKTLQDVTGSSTDIKNTNLVEYSFSSNRVALIQTEEEI